MTSTTMTTQMTESQPTGRWDRSRVFGIRTRLLVWFVLLLSGATVLSVLVVREVLLHRIDERIDRELVQETRELRALASGNDPETGRPFDGRVRKIFQVFLARNIPSRYEAIVTFTNGEPFLRSRRVLPYRLDRDPDLVARWGDLTESERGTVETPAGVVEFLAVPVRSDRETDGVFVVALFRDLERQEIAPALAGVAITGLVVLVMGSILAWFLADRILRPVRGISALARSISESDLNRRIEIEGRDEVAELAKTFNDMLDRLEEAFAAQKQFIDDAGHELRTPVTIIRGHLETMKVEDAEDRERTKALLMDELSRMSRLIEDLFLLARSDNPDFLDLNIVDVESLTTDVLARAEAIAPRAWTVDGTGKGRIVADRQRFIQALVQLAQNASQHTGEGDAIAIGSEVSNGEARFWVRDSGPGIRPADRERIFERFEQGGNGGGAGLGLAIVKAIADAHHGRIELDSVTGRGSTFRIVIPVDQPIEGEKSGR